MSTGIWFALTIAIALFAALLAPYLFEEIKRGKVEIGPRTPDGAGDIHPGYAGNPDPDHPTPHLPEHPPLSLRSFHVVLMSLSVVLATGTGFWALFNGELLLAAISLMTALLLIGYGGYFMRKTLIGHIE
jgi:hypothetical protein